MGPYQRTMVFSRGELPSLSAVVAYRRQAFVKFNANSLSRRRVGVISGRIDQKELLPEIPRIQRHVVVVVTGEV